MNLKGLTANNVKAIDIFRGIKSAYRRKEFEENRLDFETEIKALAVREIVKVNKVGTKLMLDFETATALVEAYRKTEEQIVNELNRLNDVLIKEKEELKSIPHTTGPWPERTRYEELLSEINYTRKDLIRIDRVLRLHKENVKG